QQPHPGAHAGPAQPAPDERLRGPRLHDGPRGGGADGGVDGEGDPGRPLHPLQPRSLPARRAGAGGVHHRLTAEAGAAPAGGASQRSMNGTSAAFTPSGSSTVEVWPAPGTITSFDPGISAWMRSALAGTVDTSWSPTMTSV